ncbi:MAG: T9SS type A sorting domain-containing protein [Parafilimonas sp.]
MKKNLLLFYVCFASNLIYAQTTFTDQLKDNNFQYSKNLIQATNGDYFITASYDSGFYVSRVNKTGKILWQKVYGDRSSDRSLICNDSNTGFVIAGNIYNASLKNYTPAIVKCDHAGNIIWAKSFQFTDNNFYAYPASIIRDSQGNYVVLTVLSSNPDQIRITKFDTTGNIINMIGFKNLYTTIFQAFRINMFQETSNGNYLIGMSYASATVEGHPMGYLLLVDAKGNIISYKSASPVFTNFDNSDQPISLFKNHDENLLIGYYSKYNGSRTNYFYVVDIKRKINSTTAKLIPYNNFALQRYLKEINFSSTLSIGSIINKYSIINFDYSELNKYDSSGRICPGYNLPVYSYDTTSIEFDFGDELTGIKKLSDNITVTDGGIAQRTVNFIKEICSGEAPLLSKNNSSQNAVSATTSATLFPNPAHNTITISIPSNKQSNVNLFNSNEQLLQSFPVYAKTVSLHIESYTKGVYIIKISGLEGTSILKFIKE